MAGSRRAKGEGKIERLPSGKYRCRIILNGKEISGEALPTKSAATRSAKEAVESARRNGAPLAKGRSFTTFARDWAEGRAGRLSVTTAETERYWVAYVEKDPVGAKPIDKIAPADLKGFKDRLSEGRAPATVRNICAWVNQVMRAAGNDSRVDVPAKQRHQRRPLSPDEQGEFRKVMDALDDETRLMLMVAWGMGLRRSEVCGLRHEDRDGDGVWVRRVVLIAQGRLVLREKTKTPGGSGWVPLPPFLRGIVGGGRKGFVVSGDLVSPANPKALSSRLTHALRGHDLRQVPFLGTHALRRTYGQVQLETGADPGTVADSMRHDVEMLMNEYSRSRRDLKTAAVDRAFADWDKPPEKDRGAA